MNILYFVLLIIVHMIIAFIYQYCFDTPKFWKSENCQLSMPKLSDISKENFYKKPDCLDDVISPYEMQKYLEDIILPTHEYFVTVKEIEKIIHKRKNNSTDVLFCWIILHAVSATLMGRVIKHLNLSWTISLLFALIIGIFCTMVVVKIYKRTSLLIPSFCDTKEDLENDFKHHTYRVFGISDKDAFNLFAIERHANYIYSIYETVVFRNAICKIVLLFTFLLYFIFRPYPN